MERRKASEIIKSDSINQVMLATKLRFKELGAHMMIGIIGDEETCLCYLLAGIGYENKVTGAKNFVICNDKTTPAEVADSWRMLIMRRDIAIILINQNFASMVRDTLHRHTEVFPIVLELPSKGQTYDISVDPFFNRIEQIPLFGEQA